MTTNYILENGRAYDQTPRTISSELSLPEGIELRCVENQGRKLITRIPETDDAVILYRMDGPSDNQAWENVALVKGYFSERKTFAKICGTFSRKYGIPFEVCLAIGTEESLIIRLLAELKGFSGSAEAGELRYELSCGIGRRKNALRSILSEELYSALRVEEMGQTHSSRLATFVAERI